ANTGSGALGSAAVVVLSGQQPSARLPLGFWMTATIINGTMTEMLRLVQDVVLKVQPMTAVYEAIAMGLEVDAGSLATTPLMCAVEAEHQLLVDLLLKSRASPDTANKKGVRPLHIAAFSGVHPMLDMLLSAGADVD
ncbi:unnamed protein product, partial [Polarella glacialis]